MEGFDTFHCPQLPEQKKREARSKYEPYLILSFSSVLRASQLGGLLPLAKPSHFWLLQNLVPFSFLRCLPPPSPCEDPDVIYTLA